MTMNNSKYLIIAVASFIAMLSACADGTAVEPNQGPLITGDLFSSSTKAVSSSSLIPLPTSSATLPLPNSVQTEPSSSASSVPYQRDSSSDSITAPAAYTSSSASTDGSDLPQIPPSTDGLYKSLDGFIQQYGNTDIHFDENVLAYHLVKKHLLCEDEGTCDVKPTIYEEYRYSGFYKNVNSEVIEKLYPETSVLLKKRQGSENCPLHLLNIETKSSDGFVLTNIAESTLKVADLETDYCETDSTRKVFGILFEYCGDISQDVVIEHQKAPRANNATCKNIDYNAEWVNPNLL